MKVKTYYYAVWVCDSTCNFAFVRELSSNYNIKSAFEDPRISAVNICATRKECIELVDNWNKAFKENGTYKVI